MQAPEIKKGIVKRAYFSFEVHGRQVDTTSIPNLLKLSKMYERVPMIVRYYTEGERYNIYNEISSIETTKSRSVESFVNKLYKQGKLTLKTEL